MSSSSDIESDPEIENRQLSYPPIPIYLSPPIILRQNSKEFVGLLTPTEELSEFEFSSPKKVSFDKNTEENYEKYGNYEKYEDLDKFNDEGNDAGISEEEQNETLENGENSENLDNYENYEDDKLLYNEHDDEHIEILVTSDTEERLYENNEAENEISKIERIRKWQEEQDQNLSFSSQDQKIFNESFEMLDSHSFKNWLNTLPPSQYENLASLLAENLQKSPHNSFAQMELLEKTILFGEYLQKSNFSSISIENENDFELFSLIKELCTLSPESNLGARALGAILKGGGPSRTSEGLLKMISSKNNRKKIGGIDGLTYSLLTFPRDDFDIEKISNTVSKCLWSKNRNVRQGALECLSVIAHVLGPPGIAMPFLRELIAKNRPIDSSSNPTSALSARISRRILPSLSSSSLIDYPVFYPRSGRNSTKSSEFVSMESMRRSLEPILSKSEFGADVNWILHGDERSGSGSDTSSSGSTTAKYNFSDDFYRTNHSSGKNRKIQHPDSGVLRRQIQNMEFERSPYRNIDKINEFSSDKIDNFKEEDEEYETFETSHKEFPMTLNEDFEEIKISSRDRDSGVSSLKSIRLTSPEEDESPKIKRSPSPSATTTSSSATLESDDFILTRPTLPRSIKIKNSSDFSFEEPDTTTEIHDKIHKIHPEIHNESNDEVQNGMCNEMPMSKIPLYAPRLIKPRAHIREIKKKEMVVNTKKIVPITTPRKNLAIALTQLASPEWDINIDGFNLLTRILQNNPQFILAELHKVNMASMTHLSNLRSQVTRSACLFFDEMFSTLGRALENDSEKIGEKLLDRTADTNKFIREASITALESLVRNTPPGKVIVILENFGSRHKNSSVRTTTAQMLKVLVEKIGPDRAIHFYGNKILPMLIKFLTEGSLETRTQAKNTISTLVTNGNFESALRQHVPVAILRNVEKTISVIKNELIAAGG